MKTLNTLLLALALALLAVSFGCDSDGESGVTDVVTSGEDVATHDHEEGEDTLHDMVEDACVHMQTGPFEAVTAAESADGAPEITPGHLVNEVTLTAGAGFLTLTVDEHGEFLVASSSVATIALADTDGAPVAPEESPDVSDDCAAIVTAHVFHIEAGSYTLSLAADGDTTDLDLFVGHMGHHEHDTESE